jgi:hypothetical protein
LSRKSGERDEIKKAVAIKYSSHDRRDSLSQFVTRLIICDSIVLLFKNNENNKNIKKINFLFVCFLIIWLLFDKTFF